MLDPKLRKIIKSKIIASMGGNITPSFEPTEDVDTNNNSPTDLLVSIQDPGDMAPDDIRTLMAWVQAASGLNEKEPVKQALMAIAQAQDSNDGADKIVVSKAQDGELMALGHWEPETGTLKIAHNPRLEPGVGTEEGEADKASNSLINFIINRAKQGKFLQGGMAHKTMEIRIPGYSAKRDKSDLENAGMEFENSETPGVMTGVLRKENFQKFLARK